MRAGLYFRQVVLHCEQLGNYFVVQGNGTFPLIGVEPVHALLSLAFVSLFLGVGISRERTPPRLRPITNHNGPLHYRAKRLLKYAANALA